MKARNAFSAGPRWPGRRRAQAGVGLIEVMIAVLILSIGFLGVGALLAMSLSTNNSAMSRSRATVDTYSILDAMRADIGNAKGGLYNGTVTASACPTDVSTLANYQIKQWCAQLKNINGAVSSTSGTVTCTNLGDCKITVQFDDSRAGLGGSNQQKVVTEAIL